MNRIELVPGDVVRSPIYGVVMQRNAEGMYHGEMIYDSGYQVGRHSMLDPTFVLFSCLRQLTLRAHVSCSECQCFQFSWLICTMHDSRMFALTQSKSRCAIVTLPFKKFMVHRRVNRSDLWCTWLVSFFFTLFD